MLLDSGTEGTFIDQQLAKENWIRTLPLGYDITPRNIDGTTNKGSLINKYVNITMGIGAAETQEKLLVTDLRSHQVILGLSWLQKHNPQID